MESETDGWGRSEIRCVPASFKTFSTRKKKKAGAISPVRGYVEERASGEGEPRMVSPIIQ